MANDLQARPDDFPISDDEEAPKNGHALIAGMPAITRRHSAELAAIGVAARVRAEVEAAYAIAQRFPRHEDAIRAELLRRCEAPDFAVAATYAKPIGGTTVRGFTIRFAEEFLRLWGNVNVELTELYDDEEKQIIQVAVRDLQTNMAMRQEFTLLKIVERSNAKNRVQVGQRINSYGEPVFLLKATEDEMQTKKAAQLSKAMRQIALRMAPAGLKAECDQKIRATMATAIKKDPDAERKAVLDSFSSLGVNPKELGGYLNQDVRSLSPAQLHTLRELYTGIKEGTTTWASVKASKHQDAMTNEAQLSLEDMTPGPVTGHVSPREPLKKK